MALQYVGGNTGTWAGATSGNNTVSLTALTGGLASAAAAGDIVVAVYATGSAANRTLAITDGTTAYTAAAAEQYSNGSTYDTNLYVAYKVLTAADTSVTFGPTGNAQDAGAAAVHVWRGINRATPLDVTSTVATGTGTGRPDAPAITPTTAGSIILVAGGAAAATGVAFTAGALSNFRSVASADTNDAMVGLGSFAWTSGPYDPAAWTGGTANAVDSWAAVTLALRPTVDATLTPTLFTNGNTFYAATVTSVTPSQDLAPSLVSNAQTFYAATVAAGAANLSPPLVANAQQFFGSTVGFGAWVVAAPLVLNEQSFFAPQVASGDVHLLPGLLPSEASIFLPVVGFSALEPPFIGSVSVVYGPSILAFLPNDGSSARGVGKRDDSGDFVVEQTRDFMAVADERAFIADNAQVLTATRGPIQ